MLSVPTYYSVFFCTDNLQKSQKPHTIDWTLRLWATLAKASECPQSTFGIKQKLNPLAGYRDCKFVFKYNCAVPKITAIRSTKLWFDVCCNVRDFTFRWVPTYARRYLRLVLLIWLILTCSVTFLKLKEDLNRYLNRLLSSIRKNFENRGSLIIIHP